MTPGARWARRAAVLGAVLACLAGRPEALRAETAAREEVSHRWALVVHPSNPVRSMSREEVARIWRRRNRFWPAGTPILPINLPAADPLRAAFTHEALGSDDADLVTYWNRQYFEGISPPAVLQSSKAVRAYVAVTPSAIGYIEEGDVDASVAVVEVGDAR